MLAKAVLCNLPVCCTNNEDVFLGIHTVHFCQQLIDDSVCSTTWEENTKTLVHSQ